MIGKIFLSRYQVEEALQETALFRSFKVRDLLGKRLGLLFLYPYQDRPPLDPGTFAYLQTRFHEVLGSHVSPCQLGVEGKSLYVLSELDESARPLRLPMGKKALGEFLARVLCDLQRCREAGLRIFSLSPELIWLDQQGEPLYLPPVFMSIPGLQDVETADAPLAPELRWESDDFAATDLYCYGALIQRLSEGRSEWKAFQRELLPLLLADDPSRRPLPAVLARAKPLAALPELADLRSGAERSKSLPELPAACREELQAALEIFLAGENVLLSVEGGGSPGRLSAWRPSLMRWLSVHGGESLRGEPSSWTRSGAGTGRLPSLILCEDCELPSLLLSPLWSRLAAGSIDERIFILYDADTLSGASAVAARALELFKEIPRLQRRSLELPPLAGLDPAERLARCSSEDRSLLEILALQDEALALGLLARFFPVQEGEFFASIASLHAAGELCLNSGLDEVIGAWGLRAELADPLWRTWLRNEMDPSRRRELHRLCVNLLGTGGRRSALSTLLRLRHLVGAEDWTLAAREGLELFRKAREGNDVLLLEELAGVLKSPGIEAELPVAGRRELYLHMGGCLQQQGRLEEAIASYRRGLHSLTGNPRFLEELLADASQPPEIREPDRQTVLPAVSAMVRSLADINETRGEFAQAVQCLGRLLDAYTEDFSACQRGVLYNDLAWLYYRMGQHEQAVERCEVSLRLFDPHKHLLELGQTYNTLGAAQWALNHWTEAEAYYKRALALREKAGDEDRVAASLNNLGNLYRLTERLPQAIDYFNRSMAIKKRHKNYAGYLASLYNVALITFEMNDLKAAHNQCHECLELNRRVGNVQLGAEVKGLLGEIAQVEGKLEEAREYLEEAIRVCREIEAHTELAAMLRRLVPVQLAAADLDAARSTIEEGLRETWRVGSRFEEAQIRVFEAEYQLARGDGDAAVRAFEKAADIFSALDRYEWLARVYSRMGLVLLDDGFELKARECLQQSTDIIERRKVSALIAEWDTLQMRLQQRLGHYVQRIKGEGKTRLASLYQALNLTSGRGEPAEILTQMLALLTQSFTYRRVALCLFDGLAGAGEDGPLLLGVGDFPDESEWIDQAVALKEMPRFSVEECEVDDSPLNRLFIPLQADGRTWGMFGLERPTGECGREERDFLSSFGRLLVLKLGGGTAGRVSSVEAARPRRRSGIMPEARFIGKGRDMQRVRRLIRQVQNVDATVLITGESGTGKEEVARAIHYGCARRERPFLPVNCASIPESLLESILFGHERGAFTGASHRHIGIFEEAEGGTVLLDEIGEMGPDMQAKLLRVLQNKQFTRVGGNQSLQCDVRVLTATNRDLETDVGTGRFREDLYYRVNVLRIHVAPLREKREDIPLLIEHFLVQSTRDMEMSPKRLSSEVMELFLRHSWPGNVRQLANVISSCVILSRSPIIQREDLPEDFQESELIDPSGRSLDELAEMVIRSGAYSEQQPLEEPLLAALARHLVDELGSKAKAARMLGISRPALYRRLKIYDTLHGRGE